MNKFKRVLTRLIKFLEKNINTITWLTAFAGLVRIMINLHTGDLLQALYSFLTVTVFIGISILLELVEINQRGGR